MLAKNSTIPDYLTAPIHWFRKMNIKLDFEILDIGCGAGNLLLSLRREGFSKLVGIDPFIEKDIFYDNGIKIFKQKLVSLNQKFDLIMLHHSFEHMQKPLLTLQKCNNLLRAKRYILIRIPCASSYAWRKYGTNWYQIDAPRHLFVHTIESMKILARQAKLQIADIEFDSNEAQFWASEQYCKDISLQDNRSYCKNPRRSIFSEEEIELFKKKAKELNVSRDGDQACFYLYKK